MTTVGDRHDVPGPEVGAFVEMQHLSNDSLDEDETTGQFDVRELRDTDITVRDLRYPVLRRVRSQIHNEEPIDPEDLVALKKADLSPENKALSWLNKVAPSILFAGYLATGTALHYDAESFPDALDQEVPKILHSFGQTLHALLNFEASSPSLRDHVPYLSLQLSIGWAAGSFATSWWRRHKNGLAERAQTELNKQLESGTRPQSPQEKGTVALIGKGDSYAQQLAESSSLGEVILVASQDVGSDFWVKEGNQRDVEATYKAFDRAGLGTGKIDEVQIYPIDDEHGFLPGDKFNDMSGSETISKIESLYRYWGPKKDENGKPLPPRGSELSADRLPKITIIGNKHQRDYFPEFDGATGSEVSRQSRTLEERIRSLIGKTIPSNAEIEFIDPTELILQAVSDMTEGAPIRFCPSFSDAIEGSEDVVKAYAQDLAYRLRKLEEPDPENNGRPRRVQDNSKPPIRLIYNWSDVPTSTTEDPRDTDVYVLMHESQRLALIKKGVSSKRIFVVDKVVQAALEVSIYDGKDAANNPHPRQVLTPLPVNDVNKDSKNGRIDNQKSRASDHWTPFVEREY